MNAMVHILSLQAQWCGAFLGMHVFFSFFFFAAKFSVYFFFAFPLLQTLGRHQLH